MVKYTVCGCRCNACDFQFLFISPFLLDVPDGCVIELEIVQFKFKFKQFNRARGGKEQELK